MSLKKPSYAPDSPSDQLTITGRPEKQILTRPKIQVEEASRNFVLSVKLSSPPPRSPQLTFYFPPRTLPGRYSPGHFAVFSSARPFFRVPGKSRGLLQERKLAFSVKEAISANPTGELSGKCPPQLAEVAALYCEPAKPLRRDFPRVSSGRSDFSGEV